MDVSFLNIHKTVCKRADGHWGAALYHAQWVEGGTVGAVAIVVVALA
jgi:hypothetical protein